MIQIKTQLGILIVLFTFMSLPCRILAADPPQPPFGDVSGGYSVGIDDVVGLIDDLLSGQVSIRDDVNGNLEVNITDLTVLIDYLLSGTKDLDLYYPPVPDSALVITVNGVDFPMMPVMGGVFYPFKYYSNEGNHDYQVVLSDYYMGMTEVTQEQWEAVMGSRFPTDLSYWPKPNQPVDRPSYDDCKEFIARLNELTGMEFRLPTIDQWLYAARGGQQTHGYKYAGSNDIDEVAWYYPNRLELYDGFDSGSYTMPVGMKKPNELGIYDMCGNVMEMMEYSHEGSGEAPQEPNPDIPDVYLAGGSCLGASDYHLRILSWLPKKLDYPFIRYTSAGLRLLLMASSLDK